MKPSYWLQKITPAKKLKLGRPQQLSVQEEKALVKCLDLCAEFNYPMRKRDLQDLVQSYCMQHGLKTKWEDERPGRHWVRNFRKRWSNRVKLLKPKNINYSQAKVSLDEVRKFFTSRGSRRICKACAGHKSSTIMSHCSAMILAPRMM
jgi:hypothetical protein